MDTVMMLLEEISGQIEQAAEGVAQEATEEVGAADAVKQSVQEGVSQIQDVAKSSICMTEMSGENSHTVRDSAEKVEKLRDEMVQ